MDRETIVSLLLSVAWLLPLLGFVVEVFGGYWNQNRQDKRAAYLAVGCIGAGFVCSTIALVVWGNANSWEFWSSHAAPTDYAAGSEHTQAEDAVFSGTYYTLGKFGRLVVSLDYYIDSLTLVMFMMVTLIATCIHVFAIGYMSDELTDDYIDHQVHTAGGGHFHRPGRFYLFFAYMSLFSFSMLGLVIAGNIFQVFVFWELVGICSYLLIGFYVERRSASTAANKAFMVIWTWMGTFRFTEPDAGDLRPPGIFQMVQRKADGQFDKDDALGHVFLQDGHGQRLRDRVTGEPLTIPYELLVIAGIGVFAGCVGKSAQFPLQTWLPDAMEGPTPVSALVHSATMVAAGVYLVGRFFPVFTPEVLLTIAYVGCITLFLAATIAIVATDIKRVLAYSTISQLGYMMLGLGVFGWVAGMFHLITHAFFKSLMFLCSGSVIVGCHHEQEMTRMGGLRRRMPITAATMLVGVIAISGLAIPILNLGFSGFYSKDAIVATGLAFMKSNPLHHMLLFFVPLITAGMTAFYMFRLWFYTFCGRPRDHQLYDRVHESPRVMTAPLVILAVLAAGCAWFGHTDDAGHHVPGPLYRLIEFSEPAHVAAGVAATSATPLTLPGHHAVNGAHHAAGLYALIAAAIGAVTAYVVYGLGLVNPTGVKRQFAGLYDFLVEKWRFDELYDVMFVRPVHVVAGWCAAFDRIVIDGFLHWLSRATVAVSNLDRRFDETIIDGFVNLIGSATLAVGRSLRVVQTGRLRQYVMFIAVGVLVLFLAMCITFPK